MEYIALEEVFDRTRTSFVASLLSFWFDFTQNKQHQKPIEFVVVFSGEQIEDSLPDSQL
jgi:hypothetical protein